MNLLIGALTLGLILSILALGVYVSFRIFNIPDITAEGSITLGGAVAAALITLGVGPLLATAVATLAGVARIAKPLGNDLLVGHVAEQQDAWLTIGGEQPVAFLHCIGCTDVRGLLAG